MDRRVKISNDPNNTAWSRSSTKYGQKILESQGWAPGNFLGPADAPHAKLHSAASTSHIRIPLKSDNLGLGAKGGANPDDGRTTGLDIFQCLLGRLNGKTEQDVDKELKTRSNTRRSVFVEHRWGRLRFVSGGFLVGDKLDDLSREQPNVHSIPQQISKDSDEEATDESKTDQKRSSKKQTKRKCERARSVQDASDERSSANPQASREMFPPDRYLTAQDTDRTKRRVEKVERKLERKLRKEARNKLKIEKQQRSVAFPLTGNIDLQPHSPLRQALVKHTAPKTIIHTGESFTVAGGRNAVRQQYIRHKKMAMMDSKALNEVC